MDFLLLIGSLIQMPVQPLPRVSAGPKARDFAVAGHHDLAIVWPWFVSSKITRGDITLAIKNNKLA